MRRGEIWLVAGGVSAKKARPAVIVQDDRFDATDSVTVCPFTTTPVDAPLLRLAVVPDSVSGILKPSYLMIDKLTTVRRTNLMEHVGRLTTPQLTELDRRALVFLGFAG